MDIQKRIEQRAYELFLQRGTEHGHDAEDWSKAEREIMEEIERERKKSVKAELKPAAARPAIKREPEIRKPTNFRKYK